MATTSRRIACKLSECCCMRRASSDYSRCKSVCVTSNGTSSHKMLIPLRHIDAANVSTRHLTRLHVQLTSASTSSSSSSSSSSSPSASSSFDHLFKISGEFPAYISFVNKKDERANAIDIQLGDFIVAVNEHNVSRASARSVRKLINKSSSRALTLTLLRATTSILSPPSVTTAESSSLQQQRNAKRRSILAHVPLAPSTTTTTTTTTATTTTTSSNGDDDEDDYGYFSMPSNRSELATLSSNSGSSIATAASTSRQSTTDTFRQQIDAFAASIGAAVDAYVRPCAVFGVLSGEQCIGLFQNIEKLVPVSKFLSSMMSSAAASSSASTSTATVLQLPKAESMNIVCDAFKTYLHGLPRAIRLLDELVATNQSFTHFLNKRRSGAQQSLSQCHHQLVDILMSPLRFVELIDTQMRHIMSSAPATSNQCNRVKLERILNELRDACVSSSCETDSFQSMSSTSSSSSSSSSSCNSHSVLAQVKEDRVDKCWQHTTFSVDSSRLVIKLKNNVYKLNDIQHVKKSLTKNTIQFKLRRTNANVNVSVFKLKLDSRRLRDNLFDSVCAMFHQKQ